MDWLRQLRFELSENTGTGLSYQTKREALSESIASLLSIANYVERMKKDDRTVASWGIVLHHIPKHHTQLHFHPMPIPPRNQKVYQKCIILISNLKAYGDHKRLHPQIQK